MFSAAEGDAEVREVAANTSTLEQALVSRGFFVAAAALIIDVLVNPVADGRHAFVSFGETSELAFRKRAQAVGWDKPTLEQKGQDIEGQSRDGQLLDGGGVSPVHLEVNLSSIAQGQVARRRQNAGVAVLVVRNRVPPPSEIGIYRERLGQVLVADELGDLDIEDEERLRLN